MLQRLFSLFQGSKNQLCPYCKFHYLIQNIAYLPQSIQCSRQMLPRLASLFSKIRRHSIHGYYSRAVLQCLSKKFHNLIYIIAYFSLFNVPPSRQTLPRLGQGRGPCVNSRQIVQVHKTNLYCTRNPICNPCLPQKVTMVTFVRVAGSNANLVGTNCF